MSKREIIGKLTRQENINPIERNKISNTMVIHIPSPLATYYTRFSQINKPNAVLLITKKPVSFEHILRATSKINKKNALELGGAKCEITIGRKKYSGIRLKGINQFSEIENIQRYFEQEGFEFTKNVKIKKDTDSLIRVNKFFELEKVEDGIYHSPNNKDRYYIEIPKHVHWDEFREVTFDIKNNVSVSGYDVAKGIFYEKDGITEMVRIIKPNITLDMVKELKNKYFDRLK
jgi:hypothetical protein